MKKVTILLFMVFVCQVSFSQQVEECRKVVNLTIESINTQSAEWLNEHLADDFSIAGQEGERAKMVLNQLLAQLGETVKSSEEKSHQKMDGVLELKYDIEYEKLGLKEATFIFNEQNLLQELNLFKMEVKTMERSSKVIQGSSQVIKIPFTMAGNLIAVEVELEGEKRKFILDTGSPRVILNSKYIAAQDTARRTLSSVKGVGGNISGMDIQELKSLDFGGIRMENQEVLTIDLSHLEKELEQEIYGLIGFELIKDYDLLFDYQAKVLTLIKPEGYEKYRQEHFANNQLTTLPIKLEGHIPIVEASINNIKFNFGIDSGAESNLIEDDLYLSLKKCTAKRRTDELVGADNKVKKVKKGKLKKMTIGNKTFKKLTTLYSDISHLNKAYQLKIDGLIGFPVLSKQKTLISFERKELIFIE